MAQDLAVGQFYKDTINGDVLKILELRQEFLRRTVLSETGAKEEEDSTPTEFVKCECYVKGKLFGVQEMKSERLDDPRFVKVDGLPQNNDGIAIETFAALQAQPNVIDMLGCSFCGRVVAATSQGVRFIRNPDTFRTDVLICEECVKICSELLLRDQESA
jgi:hypothetical protein